MNGILLINYLMVASLAKDLSRFMKWIIDFRGHYMSKFKQQKI